LAKEIMTRMLHIVCRNTAKSRHSRARNITGHARRRDLALAAKEPFAVVETFLQLWGVR